MNPTVIDRRAFLQAAVSGAGALAATRPVRAADAADLKALQKEPAPKAQERRRRIFASSAGYLKTCRDAKP